MAAEGGQSGREWIERQAGNVLIVLVGVGLLGGAFFLVRRPQSEPIAILDANPEATATPGHIGIYLVGAVERPGVYFLPEGSRLYQALETAGGPTQEADLTRVNLSQRLRDEEMIYIPRVGEEPPTPIAAAAGQSSGLININTAILAELDSLPGIGPVLAQRILDYREEHGPFQNVDELKNVRGIGDSLFEDILDRLTVGDS